MKSAKPEDTPVTCPECHCVSTAAKEMHETGCTRSEAARQERGETGFRAADVGGHKAVIQHHGKEIKLVELTEEQLVDTVVKMQDEVDAKIPPAKKAAEALKKAKDNLDYAVAELVKRHRASQGQEPLPLGAKA